MSDRASDYFGRLRTFMDEQVFPAEPLYDQQRHELAAQGQPHGFPSVIEELKVEARKRGLWNLFLPDSDDPPHGLKVHEYAPLAELTGWSHLAPRGHQLHRARHGQHGGAPPVRHAEQKERWLQPLLDGEIRSAFAMTEPDVASSDATNISISIVRDGDDYVINGRKWWISGAADPRCKIMIVMGKTDPTAAPHRQQSMILVPTDTPGVTIVRTLPVFGYQDQEGHCEIQLHRRARAGREPDRRGGRRLRHRPGAPRPRPHPPLHACDRRRPSARSSSCASGRSRARRSASALAEQGIVQEHIAESRMEIDQARLLRHARPPG